MSRLPDDIRISQISMLGTHDTMALYGTDDLVCQSLPLHTQLNAGVRMLDIRCKNEDGKLKIYHRNKYEGMELKDVLDTIVSFFKAHPRETILMRLGNEARNKGTEFDQLFNESYWTPYKQYFWQYSKNNNNPTLSEVRNKIVLMPNFSPRSTTYGLTINWNQDNKYLRDEYEIGAIWNLYEKWRKVQTYLENANTDVNNLYFNFLSGTYGVFPYFVASGQSSPQTSAPLLLTGKLDCDDWPEFPRMLGSIA
ncbi:phosphatidylinositol-specific phospholipase C domain-containing protein [Bacteroides thetaiotaomicron]|uniref:phosphatidylinositol-specific phospholipase C domain-containing protein n=1 Tax=Bacteroides thetaiotaomicron TaxID=818 RepID=UPI0018A9A37A|nr:phosphatidylinositol-specific phospholipase C domain-containing protein [Bacteroides thetaiotaomicron]MDC2216109.1 phosphatidylinositol-specific phospholipase C domain-containing protein [Bacteroides thetaiotaomicron]